MTDGANMGVKPERALGTILGGKDQPKEEEKQTPEQLLAEIMSMADDYKTAATSYDTTSLWLAKQFYLILEDGFECNDPHDLYEEMKKRCGDQDYDFTGFMVGWANNAARWILKKPAQANPAIFTVGE